MPAADVDVLIVSHNSIEVLADCLRSITRHRPPSDVLRLGIRVYDTGSRDGTPEMVASQFPEVLLHRSSTNDGFAKANNRLAAESKADFLLLLNPDTIWRADVLTPLLAELRRHPSAVLAAPKLVYPDGRPQLSNQRFPDLEFELATAIRGTKLSMVPGLRGGSRKIGEVRDAPTLTAGNTREAEFLWATCWLVSSEWVKQHGLFDERFHLYDEDLDFCRRLASAGGKALYVPAVELVHLGGASSTPDAKLRLTQRARTDYYRVHHGRLAAWFYRYVVLPLSRFKWNKLAGWRSR